ncbi:SigE family RNA polymerase sigma factor [Kineococcus sp. R8]|uniref:SigE family RNA polymerase sigma factor n=1 Tax=Kineococcus siccus TaxID=2696567 RepID=UPI001411EA0A|nr:SigE family RNA polymerase sigma factor [Kineococcus siccus]
MREDYDAFVRTSGTRLLRVALLLTGDRGAAEDLVQDVLERMYVRWPGIDDPDAYARTAMSRHVADRWRRLSRRPREVSIEPWHDRADEDGAEARAERAGVVEHLRALPPRQRAVIVLRYFEDWSEERIADELDVSRGTVKSQASKGLARLRRAMDEDDDAGRVPAPAMSARLTREGDRR